MLNKKEILRKYFDLISEFKVNLIISMVLLVVSTICVVYAPRLAGQTVNLFLKTFDATTRHTILKNIVILILLYGLGYLLKLPAHRTMIFVGEKVTYKLRIALHEKLTGMPLEFFNRESSGNILGRINNDLMNIREMSALHLSNYLSYLLSTIFVLILIMATSWEIGLVYLCSIPLYVICFYISDVKSKNHYKKHQRQMGEMSGYMGDSLDNHLVIQAYNCEDYIEDGFDDINRDVTDDFYASRCYTGMNPPLIRLLNNLTIIIVYVFGTLLLISHEIDIGTLLSIILYAQILMKPIKNISGALNSLETLVASINRVYEILDLPSETSQGKKRLNDIKGDVEFRNVDGVTSLVNAGEIVSIIGPNDMSKTRFVEELLGLYRVENGEILLDGLNIYEIDVNDYRMQFGYVPYDRWIFNGTIAENIGYGLDECTMEDIEKVCEAIGFDKIIKNLPDRYDTVISDEKNNVSHTEKELISIARALIRNPKILILDNVKTDISHLFKDKTVFIIGNEELKNCDRLIEVD